MSSSQIAAYAQGRLSNADIDPVVGHIDSCPDCRQLLLAALDTHPSSELPQHIGRFEILEVAGRGAMGVVFVANDVRLERKVALKLIRHELVNDDTRARIEREARALARIEHPNVVRVYEVGDWEDNIYIAMQFIDGLTLKQWLSTRTDPKYRDDIIAAFIEAGEGLQAVHEAGLVHRDFKPANVIFDGTGRALVTDFGLVHEPVIAELIASDVPATGLTRSGHILGTPAYMSPEQLTAALVDPRSDQFSYCTALYEALVGHRPFQGSTLRELTLQVTAGVFAPSQRKLPKTVERILRRGLAVQPKNRFPSMAALVTELRATRSNTNGRRSVAVASVGVALAAAAMLMWQFPTTAEDCAPDAIELTVPDALSDSYANEINTLAGASRERFVTGCKTTDSANTRRLRQACLGRNFDRAARASHDSMPDVAQHLARADSCILLEAQDQLAQPDAIDELDRAYDALESYNQHRQNYRGKEALSAARQADKIAVALDFPPLRAEAQIAISAAAMQVSLPAKQILKASHSAVEQAQRLAPPYILREALDNLAWRYISVSDDLTRDAQQARQWLAKAETLDERAPPGPFVRVRRELLRGFAAQHDTTYAKATEHFENAYRAAGTVDPGLVAIAIDGVASSLMAQRRYLEAYGWLQKLDALELRSRRLRKRREELHGRLRVIGKFPALGAQHFLRAAELAENPAEAATARLAAAGAYDAAKQHTKAEAILVALSTTKLPASIELRLACERGQHYEILRQYELAIQFQRDCVRRAEIASTPLDESVISNLVDLGQIYLAAGHPELGLDALERARTRYRKRELPLLLAATEFFIAKALPIERRAEALELARAARKVMLPTQPKVAAEIAAWIAKTKK